MLKQRLASILCFLLGVGILLALATPTVLLDAARLFSVWK